MAIFCTSLLLSASLVFSSLPAHAGLSAKPCRHHCQGSVKVLPVGIALPTGLIVDARGNVYIADDDSRVREFSPEGRLRRTWGAKGSGPGQLNTPNLFALDAR